ncbi:MAG: ribonuclease HII [Dehalococcoidia bacterium]|nr:ribonuclease HII [Dehalococcoidia bacterium]
MEEEQLLLKQGYRVVAGLDEVGRGALAGPVVAAAVVFPLGRDLPWTERVRDSKQLLAGEREVLSGLILEHVVAVGVGIVPPEDIDGRGILKATWLAMQRAVEQLPLAPQFLLVDGRMVPSFSLPQKAVVAGDRLCVSISCASIVAKVARDRMMVELDGQYPGYGLARHKGYGTKEHVACLGTLGASPIHRHSFAPVRRLLGLL